MQKTRRVVFLSYQGATLLDVAGPSSVFASANILSKRLLYRMLVASPGGGLVSHDCGLCLQSQAVERLAFRAQDTVLVAGSTGPVLRVASANGKLRNALIRAAKGAERYGSVCTGAFVLAAAGLLQGKRAATHWAGEQQLQQRFPDTISEPESLYVIDGRLWTSAGVTTGIDMALAMVEADHGSLLKTQVAKQLVVYKHRPGNQSQFSTVLDAQSRTDTALSRLIDWLQSRIRMPTSVLQMAEFMGMSERSLLRQFKQVLGSTPGKFFEQLRLDAGRDLIEAGMPVKQVSGRIGYRSEAAFRSAFNARFGIPPGLHARMHG